MTTKKRPAPSPTDTDLAEWCAVLASPGPVTDIVPPGWLTAFELADKLGASLTETRRRIGKALAEGKLECKKFRILTTGKSHSVYHYRRK